MPTYKDFGIVLNSYNLGESDKILNIYTKENGLVRAICKGIRKTASKFGSRIDQLSCCYFQFAQGRNLDVISDYEQLESFSLLRSNLSRLTYAILFLEIVSNFAHEKENESPQVYDLLYSSLGRLQTISSLELFSAEFILKFLSIHGYKPQFETCVSCSTKVLPAKGGSASGGESPGPKVPKCFPYSNVLGGLLCRNCADVIDHKLINFSVLQVINSLISSSPSSLKKDNIRPALNLLREHIDIRAKSKIKSFDLVFSL